MNASTRKCTEAKRCHLMNCYLCRRTLIDETAVRMMDAGCSEEAATQYRYQAINALAFEIETPKPKAPKTKAPSRLLDADLADTRAASLRACQSRRDALMLIERLTVPQLQQVWAVAGRTDKILGKLKADKIDYVVESLVGYRLDMNAIMNAK